MFETGSKEEVFMRFRGPSEFMEVPKVREHPEHADDIKTAHDLHENGYLDRLNVCGFNRDGAKIVKQVMFRPGTGETYERL